MFLRNKVKFIAASCEALLVVFYYTLDPLHRHFNPDFGVIVERIAQEYPNRVKIGRVEFANCKRLRNRFDIGEIPKLLLYKYKQEPVFYNEYPRTLESVMNFIKQEMENKTSIVSSNEEMSSRILCEVNCSAIHLDFL